MHTLRGRESSTQPLEEVDYRCDWCATTIYHEEDAVNIAAFEMGIGQRTHNLCLVEAQLENGSHEMLMHHWCLHSAIGASVMDHSSKMDGKCAWCDNAFQFEEAVVSLTPHRVAVSKRHGGLFLASTTFPHGDDERLFHNNCFFAHADSCFFPRLRSYG